MRSPAEIRFRLEQEAVNAWRFCFPPRLPPFSRARETQLFAPPSAVVDSLRGTVWAAQLIALAEQILARRFPLLGYTVELDRDVRWRRDPVHRIETGRRYFRFLPYLDAARVGDHKIVWELNRHQHLVVLAQAWRLTGRREFLEDLTGLLDSWFEQNPYGRGINWVSALEVAFRALSWMWIDHLAGADLPARAASRLQGGLFQHASHLERNLSIYFSPNTHLLGEALALYALGRYFPACLRDSAGPNWDACTWTGNWNFRSGPTAATLSSPATITSTRWTCFCVTRCCRAARMATSRRNWPGRFVSWPNIYGHCWGQPARSRILATTTGAVCSIPGATPARLAGRRWRWRRCCSKNRAGPAPP